MYFITQLNGRQIMIKKMQLFWLINNWHQRLKREKKQLKLYVTKKVKKYPERPKTMASTPYLCKLFRLLVSIWTLVFTTA